MPFRRQQRIGELALRESRGCCDRFKDSSVGIVSLIADHIDKVYEKHAIRFRALPRQGSFDRPAFRRCQIWINTVFPAEGHSSACSVTIEPGTLVNRSGARSGKPMNWLSYRIVCVDAMR